MNNVYDIARDLVISLKETDQYKNYKNLKAKVSDNESLSKMINDFQEKNMQVQTEMMLTGQQSEELLQQVQSLYTIVMQDPLAAEYMQAEMAFTQVVSEIYGILGEVVRDEK